MSPHPVPASSHFGDRGALFLEIESQGVDAVAQAGLVARTVIEDVAQVRIAAVADGFDAAHPVAQVLAQADIAFVDHIPEAGPAAEGIVLGLRGEQCLPASRAGIDALGFGVDVLAGEGALGGLLAQDRVLLRAQFPAPFLVRFHDFLAHSPCSFRFVTRPHGIRQM